MDLLRKKISTLIIPDNAEFLRRWARHIMLLSIKPHGRWILTIFSKPTKRLSTSFLP